MSTTLAVIQTATSTAGAPLVITIGGPVFVMLIFAIAALVSLKRNNTSNLWALFWAILFGLFFASTPWGQWIISVINTAFSKFGGASGG